MLRDHLKKRYKEIGQHHAEGATGEQVIAALTDLTDEVIERIYKGVLQDIPSYNRWKFEDGLAVVALGGYGRGERSPYSDIDLMFLCRPFLQNQVERIPGIILQDLWDMGFQIGHSTRTVDDCVAIGKKDLTVRTALMEARFLTGSQALFDQFRSRYQRTVISNRPDLFAKAKIRSRGEECEKYGTTTHLLEPHIKKSKGGLRDLHLLRWLAQSRYQTSSLELLRQQGVLSKQDHRALSEAQEFLWRIRNELHFFAGRCQDSLTFEEQVRMAADSGYDDMSHLLGVERFMQRYYDHTTAIAEITGRTIEGMAGRNTWHRFHNRFNRRITGYHFLLSGDEISILPEFRAEVLSRGDRVLMLFRLAQENGAKLSVETQELLTEMKGQWSPATFSNPESHAVFLSLLTMGAGASEAVRDLHRFRILEQILPAFRRVRGLMQFNLYHKYTVDEHCLQAVEEAERIARQDGAAARVFAEVPRKEILFLALLLHDLGKGLGGDHSQEGAAIAFDTAHRLRFDSAATGQLVFLVGQHLLMTHLAFRRDLSDERVLMQFAKTVATPETLKMLYVMTMADVMAVGPGTLTAWKKDLLTKLFENVLEILTGERVVVAEAEKVAQAKSRILGQVQPYPADWVSEQLSSMTTRYLLSTPPDQIIRHLNRIQRLISEPVQVDAEYDSQRLTTEYTVYTSDALTPGIFSKITGVLAAKGLQILGATITTWGNGTVVDAFQVQDPDFDGAPTKTKMEKVGRAIEDVLLGRVSVEDLLAQGQRIPAKHRILPLTIPTRVEIDNGSSERFTIIEVFAQDRQGLLYVMAKAMFQLGLSVDTARVSTQLDQVVDVFYVTDRAGRKVSDAKETEQIKLKLTQEIEQFLKTQPRPSFIASAE